MKLKNRLIFLVLTNFISICLPGQATTNMVWGENPNLIFRPSVQQNIIGDQLGTIIFQGRPVPFEGHNNAGRIRFQLTDIGLDAALTGRMDFFLGDQLALPALSILDNGIGINNDNPDAQLSIRQFQGATVNNIFNIWGGEASNPRQFRIYNDVAFPQLRADFEGQFLIREGGVSLINAGIDKSGTGDINFHTGNMTMGIGDLDINSGDLTLHMGDLRIEEGLLSLGTGGLELEEGNIRLGDGDIELDQGDINLSLGDLNLDFGNIGLGSGDLELDNGRLFINVSNGTPGFTPSNDIALYVRSGILAEEVQIRLFEDWPDYVFKKDYPLVPLLELESQIKKLGHLPEMPSAKEVKEEGIKLGENQALLLKKVEELTLYTIDLQKQIIELNKKIENQRK